MSMSRPRVVLGIPLLLGVRAGQSRGGCLGWEGFLEEVARGC